MSRRSFLFTHASMLIPLPVKLKTPLEEPLNDEDRGHSDTEDSQKEENGLVNRKQGVEEVVERPRQYADSSDGDDSPYCGEEPNS